MGRADAGPPFRAEHVGSLLRPRPLIEAFKAHRDGRLDDAGFTAAQDAAIRDAVAMQEAVGLKSISDGEFRRPSYWARFVERVDGLEVREARFAFHDQAGHSQAFTVPYVAAPLRRSRSIAGDEYAFLWQATRETPKVTLPSPPTMHFWRLNEAVAPGAYASEGACFADLARVYAEEIAALAGAGASYVQIDDVPLAMLCDPAIRARVVRAGLDPEALTDAYIDLFNAAVGGRPAGVTLAVHLCRGNYKAHFLSEGGYDPIAAKFFGRLQADAFFLEYDTGRTGGFAPLGFVPADKTAVLGLVSTKTPALEDADALCRRIDEAARYLPLERLALSPQCGFASTVAGNPLSADDQRRKLALVVEVAARVWG